MALNLTERRSISGFLYEFIAGNVSMRRYAISIVAVGRFFVTTVVIYKVLKKVSSRNGYIIMGLIIGIPIGFIIDKISSSLVFIPYGSRIQKSVYRVHQYRYLYRIIFNRRFGNRYLELVAALANLLY